MLFCAGSSGFKVKTISIAVLKTHGTGEAGKTTNRRVLESWKEIAKQIHYVDIGFDKLYHDPDYPTERLPADGTTITTNRSVNLEEFDPQYTVYYSLAKKNSQLKVSESYAEY
jgi:hypothetical protein